MNKMEILKSTASIHIKGAREHNLKNLELRIQRGALTVITGVSGSGKSSLAFDTLYAEGYRKYMESLSAQARQILEQVKRPNVDFIHGLSPVVAIEQRTGGSSPRSTIGTATEIADYARLLWTMHGEPFCPRDGGRVVKRTLDECLDRLLDEAAGKRTVLLAPWMKAKASLLREEIPRLFQRGYQRIRVNGNIVSLHEKGIIPQGAKEVTVDIVIDRLRLETGQRSRLADSLELAFREGDGKATASVEREDGSWEEILLSQERSCVKCGETFPSLTPRHFSFNHAEGACPACGGLGRMRRYAEELVVPDPAKSVRQGAIKPLRIGGKALIIRHNTLLKQLAEQVPFDPDLPWKDLHGETRNLILHGDPEREFTFKLKRGKNHPPETGAFPGVFALLEKNRATTRSEGYRARLAAYQTGGECPVCHGKRLHPVSMAVLLKGAALPDFFGMNLRDAFAFVESLREVLPPSDALEEVLGGLEQRLLFINEVGLGYLTLDRDYSTLSGGEAQRVRLATQLGMGLVGVIYVLDEPSVGLHPVDNERLLKSLVSLRDRGNTVVVVEHDEDTIRCADHLIELGPGAGEEGGEIIFLGKPDECETSRRSRTGPYLTRDDTVSRDAASLGPDGRWLKVKGARQNNLKHIDAAFPVGLLTCVTGVSGSGKSSLVNDVLARAAAFRLNRAKSIPGFHDRIDGWEHFVSSVEVDQSPIGRSPRSNPATYVKLFDPLRRLFADCPLARVRGYTPSRFSFNIRGGRCEMCQGDGVVRLDMQFLADAHTECPSCRGKRYNRETLEVRFKGHSIADVLDMSVREAMELFRNIPAIMQKLQTLDAVGLGYIRLGQPAPTLSGGEAQRIKLSLELSRREQGQTLYILDEPTTGLHWADIQKLMDLLFKLRDSGNTILIIEHNTDVIQLADWVIDLGPGGGPAGGQIVFAGTVEALRAHPESRTAEALRRWATAGKAPA